MTYQNGWTWRDDATEEQTDNATNKAAIDRLALEARHLYESIPETRRHEDDESYEPEFDSDEEFAAHRDRLHKSRQEAFAQLTAIEELLAVRGARFCRPYEHHNEFEHQVEWMERDRDEG